MTIFVENLRRLWIEWRDRRAVHTGQQPLRFVARLQQVEARAIGKSERGSRT